MNVEIYVDCIRWRFFFDSIWFLLFICTVISSEMSIGDFCCFSFFRRHASHSDNPSTPSRCWYRKAFIVASYYTTTGPAELLPPAIVADVTWRVLSIDSGWQSQSSSFNIINLTIEPKKKKELIPSLSLLSFEMLINKRARGEKVIDIPSDPSCPDGVTTTTTSGELD